MSASESVVGIILAGGLARRMGGGDKCLLSLGGKTLLQHTIARAKPQVTQLLINANGDPLRFAHTGLPIVADIFPNNLGPLAGIHAGLTWMKANSSHSWMASFASDTPFFPLHFVATLFQQTYDLSTNLVVAYSGQDTQSVFALWHVSLLEKITAQLTSGIIPRMQDWIKQQNSVYVEFPSEGYDPFFNINTPENLQTAETLLLNKQ